MKELTPPTGLSSGLLAFSTRFPPSCKSLTCSSLSAFSHILLLPLNPDYDPIIVAPHEGAEMVVVGEWVSAID